MSYNVNSFVNRNEADALKNMIFQRVRERAQAASEEVQEDVMELARESFVSNDNPFSKIIEKTNITPEQEPEKIKTEAPPENIGFPPRELNSHAVEQSRVLNQQLTEAAVHNNMDEARKALTNKKSFMGALNFLNSQAAVSLMRTRADKFEIVV